MTCSADSTGHGTPRYVLAEHLLDHVETALEQARRAESARVGRCRGRRTKEIAEEHRKREEERRAAEELERTEALARKAKEDHERILQRARELAPERAKAQAAAEGFTNFKEIIESQRNKRIHTAEAELIRIFTGQKGTRKDRK